MRQKLVTDRAVRPQTQRAVFQHIQFLLAFLVAGSRDINMDAVKLFSADGAVDYQVVAAGFRAGSGDVILLDCIGRRMAERVDRTGLRLAAARAGAGLYAVCRAGSGRRFRPLAPFMTERGKIRMDAGEFLIADGAVDYHVVAAGFRAGRSSLVLLDRFGRRMAERFDLTGLRRIAAGAGAGLDTLFGAGSWRRYHPFAPVVAKRRNLGMLAAQFCAADGAVDNGIIAASFRAGRFNAIFYCRFALGVALRGNNAGFRLIAAGAGTLFSTLRGAGCLDDGCPFAPIVAKRFELGMLTAQLFTADGAVDDHVIAAGFRAGRGDLVLLDCLGRRMAERFNRGMLATQFSSADGAVDDHIIATGSGAGRSDLVLLDCLGRRMAECFNRAGFSFTAAVAGASLFACFRAGRGCLNRPVAPEVAERGNFCMLGGNDRITDFAANDLVVAADSCAGRSNFVLLDCSAGFMAFGADHFGLGRVTAGTGAGLHALFRAGGRRDGPFAPVVAKLRNCDVISGKLLIANRAVDDLVIRAVLRAGCRCHINNKGIARRVNTRRVDRTGLCLAAAGAGTGLDAGCHTGRCSGNPPLAPVMAKGFGGKVFAGDDRIADRAADNHIIAAGFGAGWGDLILPCRLTGCMASRGNDAGLRFVAAGACALFSAGRRAGSRRDSSPLAPVMAERFGGKVFAGENRITDRAADYHIIAAGFGAGCGDLILLCRLAGRMAGRGEGSDLGHAAAGAGAGFNAVGRAGSRRKHGPFAPVVAKGGDRVMNAADLGAADGAVDHGVIAAGRGAGRLHPVFFLPLAFGVAERGDLFGLGLAAAGAGAGLDAGNRAGRFGCHGPLAPVMAERFGGNNLDVRILVAVEDSRSGIADDADVFTAGFFHDCLDDLNVFIDIHVAGVTLTDAACCSRAVVFRPFKRHIAPQMPKHGKLLLFNQDLSAEGAVAAFRLAGLRAGRRHLGIRDRNVTLLRYQVELLIVDCKAVDMQILPGSAGDDKGVRRRSQNRVVRNDKNEALVRISNRSILFDIQRNQSVEDRHDLRARDGLLRTDRAVRIAGNCSDIDDRLNVALCVRADAGAVGKFGERRILRFREIERTSEHDERFLAQNRIVRAKGSVGIALNDSVLDQAKDRGRHPRRVSHVGERVLRLLCQFQQVLHDDRKLCSCDLRIRFERAIRITMYDPFIRPAGDRAACPMPRGVREGRPFCFDRPANADKEAHQHRSNQNNGQNPVQCFCHDDSSCLLTRMFHS